LYDKKARIPPPSFHAYRAAGGDRDYRDSGCDAFASIEPRKGKGAAGNLHFESQTDWNGLCHLSG